MASSHAWVCFPFTPVPEAPTLPLRLRFPFHTRILPKTQLCSLLSSRAMGQCGRAALPMQPVPHLTTWHSSSRAAWNKTNESIFPKVGAGADSITLNLVGMAEILG